MWVLDGDRGTLRQLPVPDGDTPSTPVFSHDGRWLAYVVSRSRDPYGPFQLWLAHADGSAPHEVRGLTVNQFVGWSPGVDLLAVTAGESQHVPYRFPTTLDLVPPDGGTRVLLARSTAEQMRTRGAIWSAVWSPIGSSLAVSTYTPSSEAGTQILDVPVAAGARATVWFSIRNAQRLPRPLACGPGCVPVDAIASLAGWWRKWGIGFWVFTSGMTHDPDATPLAAIARPGGSPRLVADTLSDGTTDATAAGPSGELALVVSTVMAGREYAAGKTVERCSLGSSRCTPLPGASTWAGPPLACKPCFGAPARGPGSAVSLDPSWSPDGRLLAYVKAPTYRAGGNPTLAWFEAHQLYVWSSRTRTSRRIGAIAGSSLPTWSRDGKSLLYVSGDGLWLANGTTGQAVEIEHPLYRDSAWTNIATASLAFYGQIPWSKQFSWYSKYVP